LVFLGIRSKLRST